MTVAVMLLQYNHMKKLPIIKLSKLRRIKKPNWDYKKLAIKASILAGILLISSGYLAYTKLYLTNDRRFWMAIDNNLSTKSVVQEVSTGGTGNRNVDKTRFNFGVEATIDKISSISSKTATTDSNVGTHTVTTTKGQYVSYLNINTNEKKADGSDYNFDSIKGLWAKQPDATSTEEADNLKLSFIQPHVTLAPFGNLSAATRRSIVNDLKSSGAYVIDYANTHIQEVDGQKYIAYPVSVKLKKYVSILQKNFDALGYGTFPPLDASKYAENSHYSATFFINPSDNSMHSIELENQTEVYTNYGVISKAPVPAEAITLDALQERLQKLQ